MGERKDSIRGRVISTWKSAGKPDWSMQKTQSVCIKIDGEFEDARFCPAPRFRDAIKSNKGPYLRNWVGGCHFPWINPR